MLFRSTGGSTGITVNRQLFGTNRGGANLPSGARIKRINLSQSAGVAGNIEIVRVDNVDSATNTLTVTRGFMNTNAAVQHLPGTIVGRVNMFSEFNPYLGNGPTATGTGTNANIEIVKCTTPVTTPQGVMGVQRAQLGTVALTNIYQGSLMVTAAGVFIAGNVNVPVVGVNANSHGIASATFGANTFNGGFFANGTAWSAALFAAPGTGNANAYISTLGMNNSNIEGVYFNTINDQHYAAYYPKQYPAREIGWQMNPVAALTDVTIRKGAAYTGANIQFYSIASNAGTPSSLTVTTTEPHGLYPGQLIQTHLFGATNANTHASGVFVINSVPYTTQFTFVAKAGAPVSAANVTFANVGLTSLIQGNILHFPTSLVRHRPIDGGTNIGVNAPAYGYEAVRQSKKYFRYQSGKGMMFTTGISMCPQFTVTNVYASGTSVGSTITISTELDHGVQIGANIQVTGVTTTGYNTFYRVNSITAPNQFTVLATQVLGATAPTVGSFPKFSLLNWVGGKIRVGMFDDQNGVFWQYDGKDVTAGRRTSTRDTLGRVNVGTNQYKVTGDARCRFQDQLFAGDQIVIRGMTHTVSRVESQSTLYITPAYRGVIPAENARMSITDDILVYQSQFNKDKLDGTGPSGYVLDKTKMQMVAIQYTWYGAGFIDWGMRTIDGQMVWAHRTKNNNVNDEAYMRSGNLPARYKSANNVIYGRLGVALVANETGNINIGNITGVSSLLSFPTANATYPVSVVVSGLGTEKDEIITYSAGPFLANGNICTLSRSAVISNYNLGQTRSLTMNDLPAGTGTVHSVNVSVRLFSVSAAPDLNHWGSAVILDGRFDIDRTYQFTYNLANTNVLGTKIGRAHV